MSKLYMRQNGMENKNNLSFSNAIAYPFCFCTHRRVVDKAWGCIRQIDLYIVRHFFKEVGRNQPLLSIKFTLHMVKSSVNVLTKANVGFQEGRRLFLTVSEAVRSRRYPSKVTWELKSSLAAENHKSCRAEWKASKPRVLYLGTGEKQELNCCILLGSTSTVYWKSDS